MPELRFKRPANMRKLVGELMAIPGIRVPFTIPSPDGSPGFRSLVSPAYDADAQEIILYLDDETPQSVIDAINAAIAAHDATPDPVPDPVDTGTDIPDNFIFQLNNQVQIMRNYLTLTATQAAAATAFVPAIRATIRVVLFLVKRALT